MIIKIDKIIDDCCAAFLDNIVSIELTDPFPATGYFEREYSGVRLEVRVYDKVKNLYHAQYIIASVVLLDDDGYPL